MFFQISPVIHKKRKPVVEKKQWEDENLKMEVLSLGPFTPIPKIVFDNVTIGTVQTRKLLIKNPTGYDVSLFIKKPIPEEMNFSLSWTEAKIEKGSELLLEMVWRPTSEEACRHSFILSDGKKINRDIAVTFKSTSPKLVKASGTRSKKKSKASPVKLPLTRKSISPTKKLRLQKHSPIPKVKVTQHYSPTEKCRYQKRTEYEIHEKVEYNISKIQQFYSYQNTPWDNENNRLKNRHVCKENKENMSPVQQLICNESGSFTSPSNATFLLENEKFNLRRDTYILHENSLNKIVETNETLEMRNVYTENTESKEASPRFRDSLDSPVLNLILQERNCETDLTPSLEYMLANRNTIRKVKSPSNFEYKFQLLNLPFSPAVTPYSKVGTNAFAPSICSTSSKASSTNNSYENYGNPSVELFTPTSASQLNLSNETYTKDTSSEIYRKGNSSFETYIKGNLSGETYVKENSDGDLSRLDISPVSSRVNRVPSPIFLKPKSFQYAPIESHLAQDLSAIAEESSICDNSCSRIGLKRKGSSFGSQPTKRERSSINPKKDWSKSGGAAFRIAKSTSGLNLTQFTSISEGQTQPISSITETLSKTLIVKNPFLYANIFDPFMTSQIYCNEEWVDQQENNFRKWLNALLTPPVELNTKNDVDVAKVWQECSKKEVSEAPTKESLSLNYHTNKKLDYLRKQAQNLFRSKDMSTVLQKVCLVVETGKLSIREDKDLHLNLKLKSDIIRLILGYNPLWLRIGLETIFNETIPLKSNSDSHGLANFIMGRFLKDPHLIKKHKTVFAAKYASDLKKYILKKFLILVYFLDRAKNEKIIQHDPCLFCKNAIEKESKLVLIHFARETLSAVGDITKYLKCLGYIVTHVQSYIHEFDYAVRNLGVDLRDGVRLTRVMEIIQMRNDLTAKLRVPAISRLQKVYNMQLVFKSLQEHGYDIQYDIIAKDIVDGHKEKTLSFLWQIIYKFEAPLMVKKATTIQTWFRSLPVVLKRRKLQRIRKERDMAARKIQLWYRRQKKVQKYFALAHFATNYVKERKRLVASIKIQSFFRMVVRRRQFLRQYSTIKKLQAYAKGWLIRSNYRRRIDAAIIIQKVFRGFICRTQFLQMKRTVIIIQRKYKAKRQKQQIQLSYKNLKKVTINIQRRLRANREMRVYRIKYITLRRAAINIQSFYRMFVLRKRFLQCITAAKVLQSRYRARKQMQNEKIRYSSLRNAAICIQRRFRANTIMKEYRGAFITLRRAIIQIQSFYRMRYFRKQFIRIQLATSVIQVRYRAQITMRVQRRQYLALRNAAICIQKRLRAKLAMGIIRDYFVRLKTATIKIQSFFRMYMLRKRYSKLREASTCIQRRYRAQKAMKRQKSYYLILKKSVLVIQRKFRAKILGNATRRQYIDLRQKIIVIQANLKMFLAKRYFFELKSVTIFVQRRYLANRAMIYQRNQYQSLKNAALIIQRRWRAQRACKQEKGHYNMLRKAVINIQHRFKANRLMVKNRRAYMEIKTATIKIQRWYRSVLATRVLRERYILLKKSVVSIEQRYIGLKLMRDAQTEYKSLQKATKIIQQYYRALIQMRICRRWFLKLKSTTTAMQIRLRANKLMERDRTTYQKLRTTTIFVQTVIRSNKMAKIYRNRFLEQKHAAVTIQRWYRANVEMRKSRNHFVSLKLAVMTVETTYKAKILMRRDKTSYDTLKEATLKIQRQYRSMQLGRKFRQEYLETKNAARKIQRWYRATLAARTEYQKYNNLRTATLFIQRKYRAKKAMQKCRTYFLALQAATIFIQQRYRAQKQMVECVKQYRCLRNACLFVQRKYRAQKLMVQQLQEYRVLKNAVICIQQQFRANILAKKARLKYLLLRESVLVIQRRFRAQMLMKSSRRQFLTLKEATIFIQRKYKAIYLMRKRRTEFVNLKYAVITIQRLFRATVAMKNQKANFANLKKATIYIQRRYRANKIAKSCRSEYVNLRNAAIVLQRRFRGRSLTITYVTQYARIKYAALVIQRRYRAEVAMKKEMLKYKTLRHATFVIQRRFRASVLARNQREWFLNFKKSIKIIQLYYKSYLMMKKQRERFVATRFVVINIQQYARGYLIRKKYAPLLTSEAIQSRKLLKIQNEAAVKIQAMWKGYSLRKADTPVMIALRKRREQRIAEPRPSCQAKTLAQRCEAAMLCMTAENSSLFMVISALEDLDFITRHSQDICIRLSLILPFQLYIIITSAARSLPEMNALNMATLILINFCKYPHTRKNSWDPEYIDGVITVLLHSCDKEAPLFSTLCTLLWLFGHEEEWKQVIRAIPNIQQRFKKIHSLVHRKQNMVIKSKKININSVFGIVRNPTLPTRTANWGLDYDRPNTFTNAVFALTNLINILDIGI